MGWGVDHTAQLIWYLRAVHSYDFYAATEYPFEDDMPMRCAARHIPRTHSRTHSASQIHVARAAGTGDRTPRSAGML